MQIKTKNSHFLKKQMAKIFRESITFSVDEGSVKLVLLYHLEDCK